MSSTCPKSYLEYQIWQSTVPNWGSNWPFQGETVVKWGKATDLRLDQGCGLWSSLSIKHLERQTRKPESTVIPGNLQMEGRWVVGSVCSTEIMFEIGMHQISLSPSAPTAVMDMDHGHGYHNRKLFRWNRGMKFSPIWSHRRLMCNRDQPNWSSRFPNHCIAGSRG